MDKELEQMISEVWANCRDSSFDWREIYDTLYAQDEAGLAVTVDRLDSGRKADYDDDDNPRLPPTEAGLFKKIEGKRKNPGGGGYERGYYFFTKPTFKGEAKYRVVVRTVDQRTAIRLMERLVPDVVDNKDRFPGVKSAKVICSDAYEAGRKDLLIVYADDPDAMAGAVSVIRGYRSIGFFPDGAFLDPLPVGIKWLARGLGTASQPPCVAVLLDTGGPSYGKYLSQVVSIGRYAALQIKGTGLTRTDFFRVVEVVLKKAGIDPKFPDTIGARATDFASCCPFQDEDLIPLTLVESIKKELEI